MQRRIDHHDHGSLHLRHPARQAPVPKPIYGGIRRRPVLAALINEYEPRGLSPMIRAMTEFWHPTR
jgi:hypothetical protein